MKKTLLLLSLLCQQYLFAQSDHEFPKGWVLNLEGAQGLTTKFNRSPDLYLAELRLSPQYTVVPHLLRLGVVPALLYNNKKVSGTIGPHAALKIKSFNLPKFNSSLANLQWMLENLWGTDQQRQFGTGFKLELGQTILLSIMGHRDYHLNYWRMQLGIGYNFIYNKVPRDPLGGH
jgi:hypothetical protein